MPPTKAEHCRAYYLRHHERILRERAEKRAASPEMRAADVKSATDWNRANKERRRWIVWKHEALARGAVFVEDIDPDVVFRRDHGECHLCKLPVEGSRWVLDHLFPASAGGEHSYFNVALAHPDCNQKKGVRSDRKIVLLVRGEDIA